MSIGLPVLRALLARFDRRKLGVWVGLFFLTVVLGGWPQAALRRTFSRAYVAVANLPLGAASFGRGGRAVLVAESGATGPMRGGAIEQDVQLLLSVEGFEGQLPFGLSLRRDAYLPSLILIAALVGAPLPLRRKLLCLAMGVATVLLLSLVCVWMTAAWIFAGQLRGVYDADSAWRSILDLVAGTLLLPPSNRFALPLVLAGGLVLWFGRRSGQPVASAA